MVSMNTDKIEQTCQELLIAVKAGLSLKRASEVITEAQYRTSMTFIEKIMAGDFFLIYEPWHNLGNSAEDYTLPDEMLMRAWDKSTSPLQSLPPQEPINIIGSCGLHTFLDKALILRSVEQALRENHKRVSINTSARNMGDAEFWRGIKNSLRELFGDDLKKIDLTFEITEDDLAAGPCYEVLREMKRELPCRFAIDDFYHDYAACLLKEGGVDSYDWERLKNLSEAEFDIIDFVKLDGYSVRAALDGKIDLAPVIEKIKSLCPNAKIIVERIRTAEEAAFFRDNYPDVSAVQGMKLPHDQLTMRTLLDAVPKTGPGTKI